MKGSPITSSSMNKNSLNMIVERWMPLTPYKSRRSLRYSESTFLTATAGAVTSYVYRANDCFDPNATGTGHQPMGFDQMMIFYNHFCVVRSKLIVTFRNTNAGTSPTCCIRQDGSSTPITVIDRIVELGGNVMCYMEAAFTRGGDQTLDLSLDICRLQGLNMKTILADSTLRGDVATSPAELTYYHIQVWDSRAVTSVIQFDVILEQDVIFTEPRDAVESLRQSANPSNTEVKRA